MSDPVTTPTLVGTASGLAGLGVSGILGVDWSAFALATGLSIAGAFSYQFLKVLVLREAAQQAGKPRNELPTIDWTTTAYAMIAAVIATGALLSVIQTFTSLHSLYSIGGFYFAGAMAPQLVQLVFSQVVKLLSGLAITGAKP